MTNCNAQFKIHGRDLGFPRREYLRYAAVWNSIGREMYDYLTKRIQLESCAAGSDTESQDLKICLDMIYALALLVCPLPLRRPLNRHKAI